MSEGGAPNVDHVAARQFWVGHVPDAVVAAELCRRREGEGFHGVNFGDSQNRYGAPYVAMALGISATSTLELGTLVTNPITRHPAVTAAAAGSLQAASRGRVSIGIGTGDSALAHLGAAPAPLAVLARYVSMLRAYGAGSEVALRCARARGARGARRATRAAWPARGRIRRAASPDSRSRTRPSSANGPGRCATDRRRRARAPALHCTGCCPNQRCTSRRASAACRSLVGRWPFLRRNRLGGTRGTPHTRLPRLRVGCTRRTPRSSHRRSR